ncbi:hypothetical protein [Jiella avicenniae]|uniref:Chemotaxis protein MotC n=1 Tax=Jiella avicenniae TaxID=2907202 RepID=A0A9X1NVH2_9HYPH|nr:hypothetical protein [Jiella avicenniae]MCE7026445.1 hypothetical protein [Jiella avicenniae]
MRSSVPPMAPFLALLALVLAAPAVGEEAHDDAGHSTAEQVRQAGEAARRGGGAAAAVGKDAHEAGRHGAADDAHASNGAEAHDGAAADHDAGGAGHEGETTEGDGDAAHGADSAHATHAEEPAPTRGPQPYQVIRSLQFLQDQAARGNVSANRVQSRLLQWYGPAFERATQETWKDGRNQRAAALFVLSGGPPSVLRMVLAKNDFPADVRPLLDGALAYVENRQTDAQKLLSALDVDAMEPGLAAQINLAVAQMQAQAAPDKALERLRRVMLDGTGTLLEEAALRLAMVLAEDLGDHDRADGYARLYFDRYARSVYAGNFRARFTALYVGRPVDQAEKTVELIADAVERIPLADQLNIYLSIGRRALIAGNMKLAGMAGAKVLEVSGLTAQARQRALLYVSASTLTERDPAETLAKLDEIDRESLHPADRKLYDAALSVLGEIRKPLMADAGTGADDKTNAAEATPIDSAVVDRATKLLDAVRSDLKDMDK